MANMLAELESIHHSSWKALHTCKEALLFFFTISLFSGNFGMGDHSIRLCNSRVLFSQSEESRPGRDLAKIQWQTSLCK